jgi:hypothetical protein
MRNPRQEEDLASFRLITPTVLLVFMGGCTWPGRFRFRIKGGTYRLALLLPQNRVRRLVMPENRRDTGFCFRREPSAPRTVPGCWTQASVSGKSLRRHVQSEDTTLCVYVSLSLSLPQHRVRRLVMPDSRRDTGFCFRREPSAPRTVPGCWTQASVSGKSLRRHVQSKQPTRSSGSH